MYEISTKHGVAVSTVSTWAGVAGLPVRAKGRRPSKEPDSRTSDILYKARQLPYALVAEEYGITKGGVGRLVTWWKARGYRAPLSFAVGDVIRWGDSEFLVTEITGPEAGTVQNLESEEIVYDFEWEWRNGIKARKIG